MQMTLPQQRDFFRRIGLGSLPIKRATAIFQAAYNLGPALSPDGDFGPLTTSAAIVCIRNDYRISKHFKGIEFMCPCQRAGGKRYKDCDVWRVTRRLLVGLEQTRDRYYPSGLTIVSGYRCRRTNAAVGGIRDSRHLVGDAADIPARIDYRNFPRGFAPTLTQLGYNGNKKIIHVDHTPGRHRTSFRDR